MISAISKKFSIKTNFAATRGRFEFLGIIIKILVQATVQKPRKIKLISLVLSNIIFCTCKCEMVVTADDILLKGDYPVT